MSAIPLDFPTASSSSGEGLDGEAWARQRTVMLAFGRRIAASAVQSTLIEDAAALVAETFAMSLSGSARVCEERSTLALRLVGAGGAARETALPWDSATAGAESLIGHALSQREVVACPDLESAPFKDALLRTAGVKSGLAIPLFASERPLGALAVLESTQRAFSAHEVQFAETIGHMVSSTLARLRAESLLQNERQLADAFFDENGDVTILVDLEGRVLRVNHACADVLGFATHELHGRPFETDLIASHAASDVQSLLRGAIESNAPATATLPWRTRAGAVRSAPSKFRAVRDGAGRPHSVLISGDLGPPPEKAHEEQQPFQAVVDAQAALRRSTRRAFPYRQRIAPHEPGKPPENLAFVEVQFDDISAGGVSFFLGYKPTFETAVLALGTGSNLHYLTATVMSAAEVTRDGKTMFRIGCRFLGRC